MTIFTLSEGKRYTHPYSPSGGRKSEPYIYSLSGFAPGHFQFRKLIRLQPVVDIRNIAVNCSFRHLHNIGNLPDWKILILRKQHWYNLFTSLIDWGNIHFLSPTLSVKPASRLSAGYLIFRQFPMRPVPDTTLLSQKIPGVPVSLQISPSLCLTDYSNAWEPLF